MAVLLNQTSNLRLRLDLQRRVSDGTEKPASLEFSAAIERYKHIAAGERGEHRFVPMVAVAGKTLLDMDLIGFFLTLQPLLAAGPAANAPEGMASFDSSVEPSLGLRVARAGPEAFLVEVGIDLRALLEPIGGVQSDPGADLALFRFPATGRGVVAFHDALLEEFSRFPTDPSKVLAGMRES